MNKHPLVPMVQKQEKSELEKFTLFYEHTQGNQVKNRNPTAK